MPTPKDCPLPVTPLKKSPGGSKSIRPEPPRGQNVPNLGPAQDRHPLTRFPLPPPTPQVGTTDFAYVAPPKQDYKNSLGTVRTAAWPCQLSRRRQQARSLTNSKRVDLVLPAIFRPQGHKNNGT